MSCKEMVAKVICAALVVTEPCRKGKAISQVVVTPTMCVYAAEQRENGVNVNTLTRVSFNEKSKL